MNKKVVGVGVVLAVVGLTLVLIRNTSSQKKQELAKRVVECLYDFGTQEQVREKQRELRGLVSEEVYNQLTYDKEQRRLNTYLKFNNDSSTVEFLEVTDDYVVYRLKCASIENGRHFLFQYKVDPSGKLSEVYEAELIDFIAGGSKWDY